MITAELDTLLRYALRALPEHEREVVEGIYLRGEQVQEIAARLDVDPRTILRRRLHGLRLLRGALELEEVWP